MEVGEMTTTDTGTWYYCRVGIPSEGSSGPEQVMKAYAQAEVDGGYGLDRGDVFMLTPVGTLQVPSDRTDGIAPLVWVEAPPEFRDELLSADWTEEDLRP
jgi:hypothetical protein